MLHMFVWPYKPFYGMVFYINIILLLSGFFFLRAAFKNAGYLKKEEKVKFYNLIESFGASALCPSCQTIKTNDSRHCYICNRCIVNFDHHCNWINNCIG